MKTFKLTFGLTSAMLIALVFIQCNQEDLLTISNTERIETRAPGTEASNNLSFPVIWADNVALTLPGIAGVDPVLNGEWWYVWGPDPIDPQSPIYSCQPDPNNELLCSDGSIPGEGYDNLVKAYLQKDPNNVWQAGHVEGGGQMVYVDLVDWGDNLESVDWTTKSQIRTEVVLYKVGVDMLQYPMKHVSGWGTSEVHGIATNLDDIVLEAPGDQATVYSNNARLTIQKLNIPREQVTEGMLEWVQGVGWTEVNPDDDLINAPIFNKAIYEGGYSAEVNVKGKVIYGYTWNTRRNNEGAGDYRITFSFDDRENLFTSILNAAIIVPAEEEERPGENPGEGGGGTPVLLGENNLTYIDIRLTGTGGGKGGNNGHGGGN